MSINELIKELREIRDKKNKDKKVKIQDISNPHSGQKRIEDFGEFNGFIEIEVR